MTTTVSFARAYSIACISPLCRFRTEKRCGVAWVHHLLPASGFLVSVASWEISQLPHLIDHLRGKNHKKHSGYLLHSHGK